MTLQTLDELENEIETYQYDNEANKKLKKLYETVCDLNGYISVNRNYIVNYRDRHFYGETISSAFVESTVNEVISKRMKKKQQMRWTKKGAHLLLQVRIQTLNHDLLNTFQRWYPDMEKAC
jgi:DNA repair exonuclease SbcCD ATPase subunit